MIDEREALRAALGIGPPVLLDIKPGPLTAGERALLTRRLAEITRQKPTSAAESWRDRWRRMPR